MLPQGSLPQTERWRRGGSCCSVNPDTHMQTVLGSICVECHVQALRSRRLGGNWSSTSFDTAVDVLGTNVAFQHHVQALKQESVSPFVVFRRHMQAMSSEPAARRQLAERALREVEDVLRGGRQREAEGSGAAAAAAPAAARTQASAEAAMRALLVRSMFQSDQTLGWFLSRYIN